MSEYVKKTYLNKVWSITMARPINVEDLLNKKKVESHRIKLRRGGIQIESIALFVRLTTISTISAAVIYLSVSKRKPNIDE